MTALSKSLADALYNHVLRNTAFTSPTIVYLALHDSGGSAPAHPGKTATGCYANEVDYTGYQRQAITFTAPGGTENADGQSNLSLTFPEVGAGEIPFNVTGLSLWTDERAGTVGASGTLLLAAPIDTLKEMAPGDVPLVSSGSINAVFGQGLA